MDVFRLADGRDVEYLEVGDPSGQPVVHLHGTPGTAGSGALLEDAARRNGVRLLAVSRPGYGRSTTTPPGLSRWRAMSVSLPADWGSRNSPCSEPPAVAPSRWQRRLPCRRACARC